MKKYSPGTMVLSLLLWLISVNVVLAQYDPRAEAVLNAFHEKHNKIGAYRIDFVYVTRSPQEKIDETLKGQITVKGIKFRLKMEDGQEVYNNGNTVWNYIKGGKNQKDEVTITDYDPQSDEFNLAQIFSLYKKGFKYYLMEEQKVEGELCEVVDLTPEDKNKEYFKIRLMISKKTRDLKACQLFEKSGKRTLISIASFTPNLKIEDSYFNFNKAAYPNSKNIEEINLKR